MKCDEFLAAIETGGWFARLRARRHAARCPRCRAAHAAILGAFRELSRSAPLSPQLRRRWEQAAAQTGTRPARRLAWVPAAAALAAAACVLVLLWRRGDDDRREEGGGPTIAAGEAVKVREIDPARELAALEVAVNRLDAELAALGNLADRLDAERQAAQTLRQFGQW